MSVKTSEGRLRAVAVSWSGGKDSCLALDEIQRSSEYEVAGLLTTLSEASHRVSGHGVHLELLRAQAEALGLPLHELLIPEGCGNDSYEQLFGAALQEFRQNGVEVVAFGDLFLADVRAFRDRLVAANGMSAIYPVWGRDTNDFVRGFIDRGFKAIVSAVDLNALDESFAGRLLDADFLADLPSGVDPCGERGEFHTFVCDGPNFLRPVPVQQGRRTRSGTFSFCDLKPARL